MESTQGCLLQLYTLFGVMYHIELQDIASNKYEYLLFSITSVFKGTNSPLKKSSNIPEIYAKMFGRFH